MAFSTKEQEIIQFGKANGKTRAEVEEAIKNSRLGITPEREEVTTPAVFGAPTPQVREAVAEAKPIGRLADIPSDIAETGQTVKQQFTETTDRLSDVYIDPNLTLADKIVATGSETFKLGSRSFGEAVIGAGKLAFDPQQEQAILSTFENVGRNVAESEQVQRIAKNVMAEWNALTPEQQRMWGNIGGFAEGGVDLVTLGMANKLLKKPIVSVFKRAGEVFKKVDDVIPTPSAIKTPAPKVPDVTPEVSGAAQAVKEFGERVPRAIDHLKTKADEAAERAIRIRESSPAVAEAIKVDLPDNVITLASGSDNATTKGMKEMVDIVSDKGSDVRHSTVAGNAASSQYKLIDNKRKAVGQDLGNAIKALPETKIDMRQGLSSLDETLVANNIGFDSKGRLNFDLTKFSDEQGVAIQKLYDLAKRGSDNGVMDARLIQNKDSLISTLQRESRRDQIANVFLDVDGEDTQIYTVFRKMFSEELNDINPEIRKLNQDYSLYRQFVDDMDDTIFKQSKVNAKLDPADSAAINLRRIESNALSQPAFQKIIDDMAVISKELGYEGSDPASLIKFALELDALYPSKIPKASLAGSLRVGLGDIAEKVLRTGAPDLQDQQKALRNILDELLGGIKKSDDVTGALKRNPNLKPIDLSGGKTGGDIDPTKQGGYINFKNVGDDFMAFFGKNRWSKASAEKLAGELDAGTAKSMDTFTKVVAGEIDNKEIVESALKNGRKFAGDLDIAYKSNKDLANKFSEALEIWENQIKTAINS